MAEFYDIYPKDRWKDPSYRLMDKFSLKGKKGFVTGGGGGIGRNVAAAWAEAGADVALEADVFLRQRGGQQGNSFGEEAVEPLARVVLCDLEFFHGGHPALSELVFGYFTTREQEL